MTRKATLVLIAAFVLTRMAGGWLADHPEDYGEAGGGVVNDVILYEGWASQIIDQSRGPYGEVAIEYPPGSLPFIAAPQIGRDADDSYRTRFIALMLLIDAFGLLGLMLLTRRWGSRFGPWLWIALLPLLGPIVYLRLDLIPAVATIWAIERGAAKGWLGAGGWLGFGAIAKVYPALFLPAALVVARDRTRFAIGAAATIVLPLLPLLGSWSGLYSSVVGYHTGRGVQAESLWGSALFIAARRGYQTTPGFNFGAMHFSDGSAPLLKLIALILTGAIVLASLWVARRVPRGDMKGLSSILFTTMVLLLAVGTVFSPQFLLWLFALAAVSTSSSDSPMRLSALMLVPISLLSQAIFPFLYQRLLTLEPLAVSVLWCRNLLVVSLGVLAASALHKQLFMSVARPEAETSVA